MSYLRTTRAKTPVIYKPEETFPIGGCKVHKFTGDKHEAVIIAAGITLHEALKAQKVLFEEGVDAVVVDLYSVKPIDKDTLLKVTEGVKKIVVVEDHYEEGGIAEAEICNWK
ncbi:MAG: transketolase C-terminal domain-containing protein [Patescibacteria group bacterium]